MLDCTDDDHPTRLGPACDLGTVCAKEPFVGMMNLLCLDGVATAVLRRPA